MSRDSVCVIVCGGPESIFDVCIPADAFIICADSGYDKAVAAGVEPDLLIGDFDSIKSDLPNKYDRIKLSDRKDDTDTMFCVRTALRKGFKKIILAGASKGREDHFIANIQTLKFIALHDAEGTILGDETDIYYCRDTGKLTLPYKPDRYFSVFSLAETSVVSIENAEYNISDFLLHDSYPIGVSNKVIGEEAYVMLSDGEIIAMSVKEKQ